VAFTLRRRRRGLNAVGARFRLSGAAGIRSAGALSAAILIALIGHGCSGGETSYGFLDARASLPRTVLPPLLPASRGRAFHVSPTGSDGNEGTRTRPWRTVAKALRTLRAGQTAFVHAGVYQGNHLMERAGTASNPITLRNFPGERPVLRPALGERNNIPLEIASGARFFRLHGFVIAGASGESTTNIYVSGDAHHIEISGCDIRSSTQHGVYSDRTARNLYIIGNSIHGNGRAGQPHQNHGLYIEGKHHLLANNVVFDQRYGWGIHVYPASDHVVVTGNTVVGNQRGGIVVGGDGTTTANRTTIVNNIVAFNDGYGIHGYYPREGGAPGSRNAAYNNLAYRNGSDNFTNDDAPRDVIAFGRGNVSANPRFVGLERRNLRLRSGSPAINHALSRYSLSRDYDGRRRPQGEASDIGAFEAARAVRKG
jgi:Right handed beta helix region